MKSELKEKNILTITTFNSFLIDLDKYKFKPGHLLNRLKTYHRYLVKSGDFYTAKIVYDLLRFGETYLGIFFDRVKILKLFLYVDIENPYEIILTTDNKLIWRTYGLYKQSKADTLSD